VVKVGAKRVMITLLEASLTAPIINLRASEEISIVSGVTLFNPKTFDLNPVTKVVNSPSEIFADKGARLDGISTKKKF
jgi:hypothetical protein